MSLVTNLHDDDRESTWSGFHCPDQRCGDQSVVTSYEGENS